MASGEFNIKLSPDAERRISEIEADKNQCLRKRSPLRRISEFNCSKVISTKPGRNILRERINYQEESSQNDQEEDEELTTKKTTRTKRGPYKKYNEEQKRIAINLARQKGIPIAAKDMEIPSKNLKRWIESGHIRKKGKVQLKRWPKNPRPGDGERTEKLD